MSAHTILHFLLVFKYPALYLLVIVEGFFTTVAAGALSAQGIFNVAIAWLVVVGADVSSDFLYYTFGKKISKTRFAKFLGLAPSQIHKVQRLFTRFGAKTIILAKISSYLAVPVIVAAGAIHMPKRRFYAFCAVAAMLKATVLVTLGYLFGTQIHHIANAAAIASVGISLAISSYVVGTHVLRISRKLSETVGEVK